MVSFEDYHMHAVMLHIRIAKYTCTSTNTKREPFAKFNAHQRLPITVLWHRH